MNIVRTYFLPIILLLLTFGLAEACPTCKESVAENGGNLVRGYFWSIVFMMSMPFLIVGGLGTMFYLDVRRARRMKAMANQDGELQSVPVGAA